MFVAGQRPLVVVVIITGAQEEVRRSSLKRRKSEETDIWAWSTMFSQILVFLPKPTQTASVWRRHAALVSGTWFVQRIHLFNHDDVFLSLVDINQEI